MRLACPRFGSRDKGLEAVYSLGMPEPVASHLGRNIRQLREARGLTQQQMAKLAEVPRATWANLESGAANPTLSVLHRVAEAFQVTLEELVATPRPGIAFYPRGTLPEKLRGTAKLQKLLPDAIPGMEMDRMELPPRSTLVGVPHTPGTREYLTCERGQIVLVAAGERWELAHGDVVVFRGDQRHSYTNPGTSSAIGYSVVVLART
jgi:XRE family transcriptional regulator, regulator of sulfur utilization